MRASLTPSAAGDASIRHDWNPWGCRLQRAPGRSAGMLSPRLPYSPVPPLPFMEHVAVCACQNCRLMREAGSEEAGSVGARGRPAHLICIVAGGDRHVSTACRACKEQRTGLRAACTRCTKRIAALQLPRQGLQSNNNGVIITPAGEGAATGDAEGAAEGVADGAVAGEAAGAADGDAGGETDGVAAGTPTGDAEGDATGAAGGDDIGLVVTVGATVGADVDGLFTALQ